MSIHLQILRNIRPSVRECMLVIERVGIVDRTIRPYTIQSSIKSTRCCSIENHALVANVHVHVAIAMHAVANIGLVLCTSIRTDWSTVHASCPHAHVGLVVCAHRIGLLICVPKYIYDFNVILCTCTLNLSRAKPILRYKVWNKLFRVAGKCSL